MRRLSRPGCHGQRANSSSGGSTLSLRGESIGELEQGARSKPGKSRYIHYHETGCAQLDQTANRSCRGLRQSPEVTPRFAGSYDHETHPFEDNRSGHSFLRDFRVDGPRGEFGDSELHLVPWSFCPRLCAGTTIGRTEGQIHRKSARKLWRAHARQSIFETIYVGGCSESESADGALSGGLFFHSAAQSCRRRF